MTSFKLTLTALYQKYKSDRDISLTESQFYPIIFAFPPLIVVACDGVVDDLERKSIEFIAKSLAFSYNQEGLTYSQIIQLANDYVTEFDFLLENMDKYENDFLQVLDNYLSYNEDEKPDVKEMIITAAEASDGISDVEQEAIDRIIETLHLNG